MNPGLSNVLEKLFKKTGYDLTGYRESTLERRVVRRLHATHSTDYPTYVQILENSPEECHFLLRDLTIRVTDFFRDWSEESLCEKIWPSLAKQNSVKIWSAGCATGEETYSLALSFDRYLKQNSLGTPYEILGTDIDEASIQFAKKGEYPKEKLKDLDISDVKNSVQFKKLDLVGETFPKDIDLVVCRNVLIYFFKELQEKVLLKFYDSLKPGGFLWLGKAESLWGDSKKLFEVVDKQTNLLKKEWK
ncbi:MAG: hypothetical protein A2W61_00185 [Deltaproteobacteria bacterium RIFCSPLOWO2_01_44_7]|nr:MAG: hypothetical protein A2712_09985 [Deltaproteobacteria bacterium RIFCSPHIGHO2_01_FULL_43_49]OGQ15440.1 MAG: hypothetical protein A3D22_10515 [Deltaproteobacteria bacterium RIFCSPHIGHO2_02_FULL_44_53]OGQ29633.1 MAG: hypothetical protein A3D98_10715 [Deltaproteobacteria bacterium RIFCSPHIGHO2_12_FULL_44_21]OGQ32246.1 MAG: hypothetical protein A2979_00360 [Deltaproteobacteria bacterium RIFCSPLOWO2_01_FULL_45_74]OGQ40166.1 MAG: hypothetical protein A2W61_00185 [Deltaproteobacteria bacterium 